MNRLMLKQNLKKISIIVIVPYFILCITAGGLHSFDTRAFHGHCGKNDSTKNKNSKNHVHHNQNSEGTAYFCFNDHSADKCGLCKWLKSTAKRVQFVQKCSSIFENCCNVCTFDQLTYLFLNSRANSPRSPPFFIS